MRALITGVNGQTGSYLAEYLLDLGYEVYGMIRRASTPNLSRLQNINNNDCFKILEGDITDFASVMSCLQISNPDEVYNLAAQSHVKTSFSQPSYTWDVTAGGALNVLNAIHIFNPKIKFLQASSSEMFGDSFNYKIIGDPWVRQINMVELSNLLNDPMSEVYHRYQDEQTRFNPQSPYAIAKLAAHHATKLYADSYGMFACSAIMFNKESPRRGEMFVTKKITKWFQEWQKSNFATLFLQSLELGNLDASRDWSYAKDVVIGVHAMMQQKKPDSFCFCTGETHTVREFVQECLNHYSLTYSVDEVVHVNKNLFRPSEVPYLCGDYTKAKKVLGWRPKTSFKELVRIMLETP